MTARKIMLLGDIGVGKTSIIRRLVFDRFDTNYKVTINVEMYDYTVPDAGPNGDQRVDLVIWDTDGNMSGSIFDQKMYMAGASAALIIGDVTRRQSLETMLRLAVLCGELLPGR